MPLELGVTVAIAAAIGAVLGAAAPPRRRGGEAARTWIAVLAAAQPCLMLATVGGNPYFGLLGFAVLYPALHAVGVWVMALDSSPVARRWVLASAFAFAATWSGMEWSSTRYSESSAVEKLEWDARYPEQSRRNNSDVPSVVSGFPLRVVEGTGGYTWYAEREIHLADSFRGPHHVPMHHGLWGLWLNYGLLAGTAWLLIRFLLPDRALGYFHALAVVCALASILPAASWLGLNAW